MNFTKTMDAVLQTIWHLRSSTGKTELCQLDVERTSKDFTENGKEVGRTNWAGSNASKTWQAIKKAIAGKLDKNHPVEMRIATFGESDKAGLFLAQREKMSIEFELLKCKLSEVQVRHAEFRQLVENEQYLKGHEDVYYTKRRDERFNSQKELGTLRNTLQATQQEVDRLTAENKTLQKHRESTGVVENAKYRLYEPAISELEDVFDLKELQTKYTACVVEEWERVRTRLEKSPSVNDVVIIFHTFNINVREFVRDKVAFRHLDRNLVFACCMWNPEKRQTLMRVINGLLAPIRPRVIIAWGDRTDSPQGGNVIPIKHVNPDLQKKLQMMSRRCLEIPNYDPVREHYQNMRIVRVGND